MSDTVNTHSEQCSEVKEAYPGTGAAIRVDGGKKPTAAGGEPRTAGHLPRWGWFGLGLLVIGLLVIGIAITTTRGGATEDTLSGGSLGPVSELPVSEEIGAHAVIGEVRVPGTIAVFSDPSGMNIARVEAGTYGLLDSQPGWARVVLLGPNSNGLFATGWVQVSEGVVVAIG